MHLNLPLHSVNILKLYPTTARGFVAFIVASQVNFRRSVLPSFTISLAVSVARASFSNPFVEESRAMRGFLTTSCLDLGA